MATIKSIKPTLKRTLPEDRKAAIKEYSTLVGQVAWASNTCYDAFCLIFMYFVDSSNIGRGQAIWHTISSDRGQLEALVALVKRTKIPMKLGPKILWAAGRAMKLAELRNDVIHGPVAYRQSIKRKGKSKNKFNIKTILVAHPLTTPPARLERLVKSPNDKKKLNALAGDLYVLSQYVYGIWHVITTPDDPTFPYARGMPDRPLLRCLPNTPQKKNRIVRKRATP